MELLIVIVNYRTAALAVDCLRSLASQVPAIGGCHVCLVDGASGDGSTEHLAAAIMEHGWGDWCTLHALAVNGGFAFANNAGIRPYLDGTDRPAFVLLLNPDTIARPGSVATLLAYMRAHPDVGIAGSRTEDPDGTPQVSAFRFPSVAGEFEMAMRLGVVTRLLRDSVVAPPPFEHEAEVDWVVGASMIVRREVFETVGLLDDRYFMYYEEVDFCLRARRAGFRVAHVPAARIVHLIGQASGVTTPEHQNRRRPAYWFESRRRYFTKNHGLLYAAMADAAYIVGFAVWRVRRAVQRKPDPDPAHMLRDFVSHSVFVKGRDG